MKFDVPKARAEDAAGVTEVLKHTDFLNPEFRTGEQLPDGRTLCEQGGFWLAEQNGKVVSVIMVRRLEPIEHMWHFEIPI